MCLAISFRIWIPQLFYEICFARVYKCDMLSTPANLHRSLLPKWEPGLPSKPIMSFASNFAQSIRLMSRPTASSQMADEPTFLEQLSNHARSSKMLSSSEKGTHCRILSIKLSPNWWTWEKFPADVFLLATMWPAMKALKAPCCIVFATHRHAEKSRAARL